MIKQQLPRPLNGEEPHGVVIVGAGHGGAQTAIALRHAGFAGPITLIGDEPDQPYDRPSMSKDYLAGKKTFERTLLRSSTFWADRNIGLRLGERVVGVDAAEHCVTLGSGEAIAYDRLVWAAGAAPRRLPDVETLAGVHAIRRRMDVDAMLADLPDARRIVVVGGGYIGLEAAAVLRGLEKSVTVLEAADRVLARVAGPEISGFYEQQHRSEGVDVRTGVGVAGLSSQAGRVTSVDLASGESLVADLVIVGIGVIPAVAPLVEAGAQAGDGLEVDAYCQTSLPDIFAIGDCANHANNFARGARLRLESVQNAMEQANVVAKAIVGAPAPYDSLPWFWSNQYEFKLQTVGLSRGYDQIVVRGAPETASFSVVYLHDGKVVALDCVNAVKDYTQGRGLILSEIRPSIASLIDPSTPLKALLQL
nr:FAD-dependent oxidoreductase [uncultured Brevundimonas sp.]